VGYDREWLNLWDDPKDDPALYDFYHVRYENWDKVWRKERKPIKDEALTKWYGFEGNDKIKHIYRSAQRSAVMNGQVVEEGYGDLYFDIDKHRDWVTWDTVQGKGLLLVDWLKERLYLEDHEIVPISSGGGFRLMVPAEVMGIRPMVGLNNFYRYIADLATAERDFTVSNDYKGWEINLLDKRIYGDGWVLRLEYTRNNNYNDRRFINPLTMEEFRNSSINEIKKLCREPRLEFVNKLSHFTRSSQAFMAYDQLLYDYLSDQGQLRKAKEKQAELVKESKIRVCLHKVYNEGEKVGARNNTNFVLAVELRRVGMTYDDVLKRLLEWNSRCEEPQDENAVKNTVRSAFKKVYYLTCTSDWVEPLCTCKSSMESCPTYWGKKTKAMGIELVNENKPYYNSIMLFQLGWGKVLSGSEIKVYFAIAEWERKRGRKPGELFVVNHRQLAEEAGVGHGTVGTVLHNLADKKLIKYKPGVGRGASKTASEISRVIPIPKPMRYA